MLCLEEVTIDSNKRKQNQLEHYKRLWT